MLLHQPFDFLVVLASALALTQAKPEFERDGPWSWRAAGKDKREVPEDAMVGLIPDKLRGNLMGAPSFDENKNLPTSMTAEAVRAECAKLKAAQATGEVIPMKSFVKMRLEKLCKMLAKMPAGSPSLDWIKATPIKNPRVWQSKPGNHVASGCTSLLKAQDNGKLEWFENQPWYRKSLKMCKALSDQSDRRSKDIEARMMKHKEFRSQILALRQQSPVELMKGTCQKLFTVAHNHKIRTQEWYSKAESMCATIGLKSPEELKSMLQRSQSQAETASGQLLKKTCENFKAAIRNRDLDRFELQPWYMSARVMCSKLGKQKVDVKKLESRCVWLATVENTGKDARVKKLSWYKRLKTACSWIKRVKEYSSKERPYPENQGLGNAPVYV